MSGVRSVLAMVIVLQLFLTKEQPHQVLFMRMAQATSFTHYPTPKLKWSVHLGGEDDGGAGFIPHVAGSSFRRGNGIVASPDGKRLYATMDDGHLAVLDPSDGRMLFSYLPRSRGEGYDLSCTSSVVLSPQTIKTSGTDGKEVVSEAYAVYAVVDIPSSPKWDTSEFWYDTEEWYQTGKYDDFAAPAISGQSAGNPEDVLKIGRIAGFGMPAASSRVIAVDSFTGREKWTYELAKSTIVGTPNFSTDGSFVYVVVNDSVTGGGRFVILRVTDDSNGATRVEKFHESGWDSSTFYPYSPMTKARVQTMQGSFDALFWVETMGDRAGYASAGRIHRVLVNLRSKLVQASYLDDEAIGSAAAPWVSDDGTVLHISGKGGKVIRKRWELSEDSLGVDTKWIATLDQSRRNGTMPLLNRAASSSDESVLFVPSSTTSFSCLDTATGAEIWKSDFNSSVYLTEPIVSKDDMLVYSILQNDGTVVAQYSTTGWPLWKMSCVNTTGDAFCQDSVEAEFTLSANGADIFYGNVYGTLTALTVADAPDPTPAPTMAPTASPVVTPSPTEGPTASPTTAFPSRTPTGSPQSRPSSSPTTIPTEEPSLEPTFGPTKTPSKAPSLAPSTSPTKSPTLTPSVEPTAKPSIRVTNLPTRHPTFSPTRSPTKEPTAQPTDTQGTGDVKHTRSGGTASPTSRSPPPRQKPKEDKPKEDKPKDVKPPEAPSGGGGIFGRSSGGVYFQNLSNKARVAVGLGFASIGVLLVSLSYLGMGALQRLRSGGASFAAPVSTVRVTV